MKTPVVGTSYIGPVSGTCLAAGCNDVLHLDIDAAKIKNLNEGRIPILKPGSLDMIKRNVTVCKNADALLIASKWNGFTAPI